MKRVLKSEDGQLESARSDLMFTVQSEITFPQMFYNPSQDSPLWNFYHKYPSARQPSVNAFTTPVSLPTRCPSAHIRLYPLSALVHQEILSGEKD